MIRPDGTTIPFHITYDGNLRGTEEHIERFLRVPNQRTDGVTQLGRYDAHLPHGLPQNQNALDETQVGRFLAVASHLSIGTRYGRCNTT